jgi:acetoacetyl-[acyl-carrier protein] synthase
VAIIGGAEAPLIPETVEGFRAMGALAEDAQLAALDGTEEADNRRACRPFSDNAGFTMAEGTQFFILMDDELAIELGATIYGSVADVFVNADANKKSISSPGIGNYITVAKCMALAKTILGEEGVKQTYAHAHGTGTPQNRVTESHILNEVAKTFDIDKWPVTGIKSYIGHSIGAAGGDQLASALGTWEYGYIPGIKTITHIADDVFDSNLEICMDHKAVGNKGCDMRATVINSKGFGGNNASALILSPHETHNMLVKKHGQAAMDKHAEKNVQTQATAKAYDKAAIEGDFNLIYHFGTEVMQGDDLSIDKEGMRLEKFKNQLKFNQENPYKDYC